MDYLLIRKKQSRLIPKGFLYRSLLPPAPLNGKRPGHEMPQPRCRIRFFTENRPVRIYPAMQANSNENYRKKRRMLNNKFDYPFKQA